LIDRRSGTPRTIRVPYASVSLTGGIQPEILSARLTRSHLSNGLFARLLFAFPTPRSRRWPERPVDKAVSENYQKVIVELMNIPFESASTSEDPAPKPVDLSPEALQRFRRFVKDFGREQADADTAMVASFAKLEGYAARLALVLHMTRRACGEQLNPWVCDLESMERGITLSRWFAQEAKRVRALVRETPEETDHRHLLDWLHRRGGQATARELSRSNQRRYPTAEAATTVLDRLAASGLGTWTEQPSERSGGRPVRLFSLPKMDPDDGRFCHTQFSGSGPK